METPDIIEKMNAKGKKIQGDAMETPDFIEKTQHPYMKLCPGCGARPGMRIRGGEAFLVECYYVSCGLIGPYAESAAEAAEGWNTMPYDRYRQR